MGVLKVFLNGGSEIKGSLLERRSPGGALMKDLAERLKTSLGQQEEVPYEALEQHFDRHLAPFD